MKTKMTSLTTYLHWSIHLLAELQDGGKLKNKGIFFLLTCHIERQSRIKHLQALKFFLSLIVTTSHMERQLRLKQYAKNF